MRALALVFGLALVACSSKSSSEKVPVGGGGSAGASGSGAASSGGSAGTTGSGGSSGTTGSGGAAGADAGPGEKVLHDFYDRACEPLWLGADSPGTNASPVLCGTYINVGASVDKLDAAVLEGNIAASKVVRTQPPLKDQGSVSTKFPGLDLTKAAAPAFKARVGCAADNINCDVKWQLLVRLAGSSANPEVFEAFQTFDNKIDDLDIDLGSYAGLAIDLSFVISANGKSSTDDILLWAAPRIVDKQP